MDVIPNTWVTIDDERLTLNMKGVVIGGSLASLEDDFSPFSTYNLAFGGLGHHFLSLDVTLKG
jgi:hypothetical protein